MTKLSVFVVLASFLVGGCAVSSRVDDGGFHFILKLNKEEKYE